LEECATASLDLKAMTVRLPSVPTTALVTAFAWEVGVNVLQAFSRECWVIALSLIAIFVFLENASMEPVIAKLDGEVLLATTRAVPMTAHPADAVKLTEAVNAMLDLKATIVQQRPVLMDSMLLAPVPFVPATAFAMTLWIAFVTKVGLVLIVPRRSVPTTAPTREFVPMESVTVKLDSLALTARSACARMNALKRECV